MKVVVKAAAGAAPALPLPVVVVLVAVVVVVVVVPHPQVHVLRHQLAGQPRAEGEVVPQVVERRTREPRPPAGIDA